jgi:hypothetical protein
MSVGVLKPDWRLKNCRAMAGRRVFIQMTGSACSTLGSSRLPPEHLASKKNAIAKPTGRIAGFWHVAFPSSTRKDALLGGTGPTLIFKIEKEEPPYKVGAGILSMQQRVKLIDGQIEIRRTTSGTTVSVRLPYHLCADET